MSAPPSPSELRRLDPRVWRACAGSSVQIPSLHSRVYYFPQGHLEQTSSPNLLLPPFALSKPLVLCRISALHFLADPVTDEVFAKLLLVPIDPRSPPPPPPLSDSPVRHFSGSDDQDEKVVSFAKILTPSDANNGGGFSVPRFCADSIFPPLNYQAEPPVQTLSITDVHGVVWDFRHIYRGTPRRHLLTTGWSKFVNHKKLVAGDSVVFMQNSREEMFVGVRRAVRSSGCGEGVKWGSHIGGLRVKAEEESGGAKDGFSRNGKGRVSVEEVAEAVELAAQGLPFEVVYYPRAGWSDFVVKAEVVEESFNVFWSAGMRVKMAMETEDSSRMTWFQGTVSSLAADGGPWQGSPWRMLQVTWDEPEVLQNVRRVSPWQVEFLAPTPPIHTPFPPAKKFRIPHNYGSLTDGEGELFFPMAKLPNSTMGHMSPTMFGYNTFPAGMQGARQNPFSVSSFSNLLSDNTSQIVASKFSSNNMVPNLRTVSTELNIGSSQSENLSPDSQSSVLSFGTEEKGVGDRYSVAGDRSCSEAKVGISSFQLFGKVIHMNQPAESNFDDASCTEDETGGVKNQLDLSLTFPYTKLLDRLDVQCQRASPVEACPI